MRLAALDAASSALGLYPGQPLAEARALAPGLAAAPIDRAADAADFRQILRALFRYSPLVASPSFGEAILDIEGCAHLFGGEERLARDALARLARARLEIAGAIADTPGAARALALGASDLVIVPPGGEGAALAPLPVDVLRLDEETARTLKSLGLKTVGALAARGRAGLARRFGKDLLLRLDQATGRVFEPISPIDPPAEFSVAKTLAEPVMDAESALAIAGDLAGALEKQLEEAGLGARRFVLRFFRMDGSWVKIEIAAGAPIREPETILRLFRLRLERKEKALDPGFGFEAFRLSAFRTALLPAHQAGAFAPRAGADSAGLKDRLANHLGTGAVFQARAIPAHLPERSEEAKCVLGGAPSWKDEAAPAPRPLQLLSRPEAIAAMSVAPDGAPISFRWRRVRRRITRACGPERILGDWRRGEEEPRDYYRIEDEAGRRYWVFRRGLFEEGRAEWFLHGFFG